jgi:hypothetical protein
MALPPGGTAVGTCRRGVWRQIYISRNFWFVHLFFENQKRKNIKKSLNGAHPLRNGIMGRRQAASRPNKRSKKTASPARQPRWWIEFSSNPSVPCAVSEHFRCPANPISQLNSVCQKSRILEKTTGHRRVHVVPFLHKLTIKVHKNARETWQSYDSKKMKLPCMGILSTHKWTRVTQGKSFSYSKHFLLCLPTDRKQAHCTHDGEEVTAARVNGYIYSFFIPKVYICCCMIFLCLWQCYCHVLQ